MLPLACRLRSRRAPCHIACFARVSIRSSGARRRGPHCCAAPPCPKMRTPRARVTNRFCDARPARLRCPTARRRPTSFLPSRLATERASRASHCGLPTPDDAPRTVAPTRHVRRWSRRAPCAIPHSALRVGLQAPDDAARTVAPCRHVRRCSRRAPKSQTVFAVLRRHRLAARPLALAKRLSCLSLAASWGVALRDAAPCVPLAISPCTMPHRASCVSRSGLAAPDDAARVVEPRRRLRRCSSRAPKSRISPRRQGLRRCAPHGCTASQCRKLLAPLARFAKTVSLFFAGSASLRGRPPSPDVFLPQRPPRVTGC